MTLIEGNYCWKIIMDGGESMNSRNKSNVISGNWSNIKTKYLLPERLLSILSHILFIEFIIKYKYRNNRKQSVNNNSFASRKIIIIKLNTNTDPILLSCKLDFVKLEHFNTYALIKISQQCAIFMLW